MVQPDITERELMTTKKERISVLAIMISAVLVMAVGLAQASGEMTTTSNTGNATAGHTASDVAPDPVPTDLPVPTNGDPCDWVESTFVVPVSVDCELNYSVEKQPAGAFVSADGFVTTCVGQDCSTQTFDLGRSGAAADTTGLAKVSPAGTIDIQVGEIICVGGSVCNPTVDESVDAHTVRTFTSENEVTASAAGVVEATVNAPEICASTQVSDGTNDCDGSDTGRNVVSVENPDNVISVDRS